MDNLVWQWSNLIIFRHVNTMPLAKKEQSGAFEWLKERKESWNTIQYKKYLSRLPSTKEQNNFSKHKSKDFDKMSTCKGFVNEIIHAIVIMIVPLKDFHQTSLKNDTYQVKN